MTMCGPAPTITMSAWSRPTATWRGARRSGSRWVSDRRTTNRRGSETAVHREFQPGAMSWGHRHDDGGHHPHHDHDHHDEHDHDAEVRTLVAATAVTGALLGLDVVLGLAGSPWQSPF